MSGAGRDAGNGGDRGGSLFYDLLPRYVRFRDAYQGKPLEAVMEALQVPYDAVRDDLRSLYEGWFIETCDLWRVPYIGALLGVRGLGEASPVLPSQRCLVANTLAYRRAKGTAAALERVASDSTGWPCHLIQYAETTAMAPPLLGESGRQADDGTVDLRQPAHLADLDTPWNVTSHGADVRSASDDPPPLEDRGGFRPTQVGLAFYRLAAMPVERGQARRAPEGGSGTGAGSRGDGGWQRYFFHPFALDVPLFNPERGDPRPLHLSRRDGLPEPLDPEALRREVGALRRAGRRRGTGEGPATAYFGEEPAWRILVREAGEGDGPGRLRALEVAEMGICDLGSWRRPSGDAGREDDGDTDTGRETETSSGGYGALPPVRAWIDPRRGRFLLDESGLAEPDDGAELAESEGRRPRGRVWVDYHYGAPLDFGGGCYPRDPLPPPGDELGRWTAVVGTGPLAPGGGNGHTHVTTVGGARVHHYPTLDAALRAWNRQRVAPIPPTRPQPRAPRDGVIRIADSAVHTVSRPVDLRGRRLLIQAVDGCVPTLAGDLVMRAPRRLVEGLWESGSRAPSLENQLALDGLWVDGGIAISGDASLTVCHCTVVPPGRRRGPGEEPSPSGPAAIRVVDEEPSRDDLDGPGRSPDLFSVRVHHSVVAGIDLGRRTVGLGVAGSLVSGTVEVWSGEASFARSTLLGRVAAARLPEAVDTLFAAPVHVELQNGGRLRCCWLPEGSRTPPRERCATSSGGPGGVRGELFRSTRFGDPDFGMLATSAPRRLREGASNGNEIGVFNGIRQGDRLENLELVLEEYLPVGTSARVWFAT